MGRHSNRGKLLGEGLRLVRERGLAATSVGDLVEAAAVPRGSFTNHFESKEDFALELLDLYHSLSRQVIDATLRNENYAPLDRLRAWIALQRTHLVREKLRRGCLYGVYMTDASAESEAIRARVAACLDENQDSVAHCLRAAVKAKELPRDLAVRDTARFIVTSLQGAIALTKLRRDPAPLDDLVRVLFTRVLAK